MYFSKPQSETDILRSMVLIGIAFILVLAALPPALTATMLEVYASSMKMTKRAMMEEMIVVIQKEPSRPIPAVKAMGDRMKMAIL
jgi:hypothetical protein